MHNVLLIAKREYLERVRARSFMVMTVLIPLVLGGLVYGTALMNGGTARTRTSLSFQRTPASLTTLRASLRRAKAAP